MGSVLLDEVLASSGGAELTIVLAQLMMLLIHPVMKCCTRQTDEIAHTVDATHLRLEMLSPLPCRVLISNRDYRSGYGSGTQSPPFYGQLAYHRQLSQG